jgi:hypothetical protein
MTFSPAFMWVASLLFGLLCQMLGFAFLASRKRGRDEREMERLAKESAENTIKLLQLDKDVSNIKVWLLGSFDKA